MRLNQTLRHFVGFNRSSRMNTTRLDHLPVELFHHLFSYFSAHEILYSFIHITSYIDSIINSYTNYRIQFKAISRTDFDLVCRHIVPDQVIALTLSDDEDTPGLVGLFLDRFELQYFTRLRALRLIDIGPEYWMTIIIQMTTLNYLRSFIYQLPDRDKSWMRHQSSAEVTQLDRSMFNIYAPMLPQLYQLKLTHGDFLNSISFPYLRHLMLERSTIHLIKHIASVAPQLQTLDTQLATGASYSELIPSMPLLNHLILRIFGKHFPTKTSLTSALFRRRSSNECI